MSGTDESDESKIEAQEMLETTSAPRSTLFPNDFNRCNSKRTSDAEGVGLLGEN